MAQLGANAHGEVLVPGRVPDCYLGLLLDPTDHDTQAAGVLVVAPAALLHPVVPQPDGTVLYELVTGHPDRTPRVSSGSSVWRCIGAFTTSVLLDAIQAPCEGAPAQVSTGN